MERARPLVFVGSLLVAIVTATAASAQPRAIEISYERARDRFQYRFENPSSFDTAELVPHSFVQTYWGDNQWLVVNARFRLGARALASEVGVTPHRTTRADDFDTFLQPGGDLVSSGTTGNVSMRSWRVRQSIALARAAGLDWRVGYRFRRDRSDFHPGLKIVTHTRPPSREESIVATRETTISNVHEVLFGAERQWTARAKWRIALGVDVSPATNARLTTILPDKYPGQEILFTAVVMSVAPTVTVTYHSRWPVSFSLGGTRTFSYADSRRFERSAIAVGMAIGFF